MKIEELNSIYDEIMNLEESIQFMEEETKYKLTHNGATKRDIELIQAAKERHDQLVDMYEERVRSIEKKHKRASLVSKLIYIFSDGDHRYPYK